MTISLAPHSWLDQVQWKRLEARDPQLLPFAAIPLLRFTSNRNLMGVTPTRGWYWRWACWHRHHRRHERCHGDDDADGLGVLAFLVLRRRIPNARERFRSAEVSVTHKIFSSAAEPIFIEAVGKASRSGRSDGPEDKVRPAHFLLEAPVTFTFASHSTGCRNCAQDSVTGLSTGPLNDALGGPPWARSLRRRCARCSHPCPCPRRSLT